LGSGQVPAAKYGQKPTLVMTSQKKNETPNQKNFFMADLKSCRVFWGFE